MLSKIKFELDFVLYYFIKIKENNVFSTLSSFAIQDFINSKFLFLFLYFVECFDIFYYLYQIICTIFNYIKLIPFFKIIIHMQRIHIPHYIMAIISTKHSDYFFYSLSIFFELLC